MDEFDQLERMYEEYKLKWEPDYDTHKCDHDWVSIPLLTNVIEECSKCGKNKKEESDSV